MSESQRETLGSQYETPVGSFFRLVSFISAPAQVAEPQIAVENQQERHERVPSVYVAEGAPGAPVVLVALKNPGPYNMVAPLFQGLRSRGYTVVLYGLGVAESKLTAATQKEESEISGFVRVAHTYLQTVQPDVIIRTATDLNRGNEQVLTSDEEARWWRATVVNVEDVPGNGHNPDKGSVLSNDIVVTIDDHEAVVAEGRNPADGRGRRVVAVGRPDCDVIDLADPEVERAKASKHLNEKYGIPESNSVVYFSGQLAPAAPTALEQFARGLRNIDPAGITFVYAFHPRVFQPGGEPMPDQAAFVLRAREIFAELRATGLDVVVIGDPGVVGPERADEDIEHLGWRSDLTVGTHPTEGYNALHRGVPTMYIGVPGGPKDTPIAVRSGAAFTVAVEDSDDVVGEKITNALTNETERADHIQKGKQAVKGDGKATDRFLSVIDDAAAQGVEMRDVGRL